MTRKEKLIKLHFNFKLIFCWGAALLFIVAVTFGAARALTWGMEKTFLGKLDKIQEDLLVEEEEMSAYGATLAEDPALKNFIQKNDVLDISRLFEIEKRKHPQWDFLVYNKNGVALARSTGVGQGGDYLFYRSIWGEQLRQGIALKTIVRGNSFPLIIIATQPIRSGGDLIGGVVIRQSLDDNFIKRLRQEKMPTMDIVFYSAEAGVVGTTATGDTDRELERQVFAALPAWTTENHATTILVDNVYYFGVARSFVGVEGPVGQFYVYFTLKAWFLGFAVALGNAGLGLAAVWILHRGCRQRKHNYFLWGVGVFLIIIVGWSVVFTRFYLTEQAVRIQPKERAIYNSVLSLAPEWQVWDKDFEQHVSINLDTGGEDINTVGVHIQFDQRLARVEDIIINESLCPAETWVERSFNNEEGEIHIACSVPAPGFSEPRGKIAEIIFQPIRIGRFTLNFTGESTVLAADGLGTGVLRGTTGAIYNIVSEQSLNPLAPITEPLAVFSTTHANSDRWYNKSAIKTLWLPRANTKFYYALDQAPTTKPQQLEEKFLTLQNESNVVVVHDGEYYFHLTAEKEGRFGPTTHFRVRVDRTPPTVPEIKISNLRPQVNEVVRLQFSAQDTTSGLQPNIFVRIDDSIWLPSTINLSTAFVSAGKHVVAVKFFDQAGNFNENTLVINVEK